MAKLVAKMPEKYNHKRAKYPWGEWLDGRVWELTEGEDFIKPEGCSISRFRNVVYVAAKKRGKKARVHVDGKKVYVQAFPFTNGITDAASKGTNR